MAKFRITDNQSGKTLVINGDTPPSEQEAEQLFQTSGIRGQQSQENPLQKIGGAMAPIAKFLMPNVIDYSKNALQEIGAGNLTPTVINTQNRVLPQPTGQQQASNVLASLLGPGMQQVAGAAGYTSPLETQKNNAAREMAQTYQMVTGLAGMGNKIVEGAGSTIHNAIGAKSLNPWKMTSFARNEAIANAPDINTNSILKAGDKYVGNDPRAAKAWKMFKETIKPTDSAENIMDKMGVWKKAFNASGREGNSALAGLFGDLYHAGKQTMIEQAPEVAKQTANFKRLYDTPEQIQQLTWLLAKLGVGANLLH